jgi:hypothetical protein
MKTSVPFDSQLLWDSIAKKYKVPELSWEKMTDEEMNIRSNHHIVDDISDQEYTDLAFSIYYFGPSPLSLKKSKRMLKSWLQKYWYYFKGNPLVEVWCKIVRFILLYNHSKHAEPQHYINQLPGLGNKRG